MDESKLWYVWYKTTSKSGNYIAGVLWGGHALKALAEVRAKKYIKEQKKAGREVTVCISQTNPMAEGVI